MRRTGSMHRDMSRRFAERKDKNGRIIQHGRLLPFTLADLRQWIQAQMPKTHGQCTYCSKWIDFADFSLDHSVPASRGGTLELSNLAICCDECNRTKGRLTGSEFTAFLRALETWPEAARKDILGRLKVAEGFKRLRYINARKPKPQPEQPANAARDEDF